MEQPLSVLPGMYMAAAALTSTFTIMGGYGAFRLYLKDDRFNKEERRLVRSKFFSLGSVIEQIQMLVVISVFSAILEKDASSGIAGYALMTPGDMSGKVYFLSMIVCILLNAVSGILIMLQHHIAIKKNDHSTL